MCLGNPNVLPETVPKTCIIHMLHSRAHMRTDTYVHIHKHLSQHIRRWLFVLSHYLCLSRSPCPSCCSSLVIFLSCTLKSIYLSLSVCLSLSVSSVCLSVPPLSLSGVSKPTVTHGLIYEPNQDLNDSDFFGGSSSVVYPSNRPLLTAVVSYSQF